MANPLVEALRDVERGSPEWHEARDRLADEDPEAFQQWLDDEWEIDVALTNIQHGTNYNP